MQNGITLVNIFGKFKIVTENTYKNHAISEI